MNSRKPFSQIDYIKKQSENLVMFNEKFQARSNQLTDKINKAKKSIIDQQNHQV